MKKNEFNSNQRLQQDLNEFYRDPEGYPLYPEKEDIYTKFKKEKRIDPEAITQFKENGIVGIGKEEDFNDDSTVSDLDIADTESENISEYPEIDEEELFFSTLVDADNVDIEKNPDL